MNKNIIIIGGLAIIVLLGGVLIFVSRQAKNPTGGSQSSEKKEQLAIERDLAAVSLSVEDQQELKSEGLQMPSGQDSLAKGLQTVRVSDGIASIEKDLQETNLSGLDSELGDIEKDLSGM